MHGGTILHCATRAEDARVLDPDMFHSALCVTPVRRIPYISLCLRGVADVILQVTVATRGAVLEGLAWTFIGDR